MDGLLYGGYHALNILSRRYIFQKERDLGQWDLLPSQESLLGFLEHQCENLALRLQSRAAGCVHDRNVPLPPAHQAHRFAQEAYGALKRSCENPKEQGQVGTCS
eukprot:581431-Amphidinium_carterae.1